MQTMSRAGAGDGQPRRSFDALAAIFRAEPGYLLFSVSLREQGTWLRRIFSTQPGRHEPGGTKDMAGTGYCDAVIDRRAHLLSRDAGDLRANFQDHEAIIADGVGSAMNLCLQYDGRVIGSANFLGRPGAYDPSTLESLAAFAFPLALLVALAASAAPSHQAKSP